MKMLGLVILDNEQVFVLLGLGVEMGHGQISKAHYYDLKWKGN